MSITITNKKICEFYKKYPDINLENLLCNFIDLIEKFAGNYSNVSEERIIESIGSIKTLMGNINNSNLESFQSILKLNSYENKDDLNKVLSTITNKNSEIFSKSKDDTTKVIADLISRNKELGSKDNEILIEKMKGIIPPELITEMREFFNKNKTSAFKGQQSENRLESILNQIFKESEIINMSKVNHCGDFHLKRVNKDTIMFENKDYKNNVPSDGVNKFQDDCSNLGMHGIILSQHSGIWGQRDWGVEIINNKILVYLTNVDYDNCKILSAVSLIDNLSNQINKLTKKDSTINTNINIDQDTMLEINEELQNFITLKDDVYKVSADNDRRLREALDKIKLPNLISFFTGKCDAIKVYPCQYCNLVFSTDKARGGHLKSHDEHKKKMQEQKNTLKELKKAKLDLKKKKLTNDIDILTQANTAICMSVETIANDESSDD